MLTQMSTASLKQFKGAKLFIQLSRIFSIESISDTLNIDLCMFCWTNLAQKICKSHSASLCKKTFGATFSIREMFIEPGIPLLSNTADDKSFHSIPGRRWRQTRSDGPPHGQTTLQLTSLLPPFLQRFGPIKVFMLMLYDIYILLILSPNI